MEQRQSKLFYRTNFYLDRINSMGKAASDVETRINTLALKPLFRHFLATNESSKTVRIRG